MGRVHTSGQVTARELVSDIAWTVVGDTVSDVSENELEIWYGPQDRFAIQVKPPGGAWTEQVRPGEFIENRELPSGTFLSIYNQRYHPANGSNLIAVYLSPPLREDDVAAASPQESGSSACWARKSAMARTTAGSSETTRASSDDSANQGMDLPLVLLGGFLRRSVDRQHARVRAAGDQRRQPRCRGPANRDHKQPRSHQGRSREAGRRRTWQQHRGCERFSGPNAWIAMSGTSMASPYIAGLAGLMLAVDPTLTAAQIGGILRRTACPLPGADFRWRDDAGAGAVDPIAASPRRRRSGRASSSDEDPCLPGREGRLLAAHRRRRNSHPC